MTAGAAPQGLWKQTGLGGPGTALKKAFWLVPDGPAQATITGRGFGGERSGERGKVEEMVSKKENRMVC